MKIGIMTFWWSDDNYGQILQCYALQKYLIEKGHDVYLIRYNPTFDRVKKELWKKYIKALNPYFLFRFLLLKIIQHKHKISNKYRKFDEFREKYLNQSDKLYYSYDDLINAPPEADVYIVGSDQTWNFDFWPKYAIDNIIRAYLLDFGGKNITKMSYAASFGMKSLKDDMIAKIMPLLQKFDYISVREKSGLDICNACGINNAEWVPDPTMLLPITTYRSLYDKESFSTVGPYCLLYMINLKNDIPIMSIYKWANKQKIKIVYISANLRTDLFPKTYPTIPQWLYLMDHAEYVITNSYHCSVFSLMFKKKFAIILNKSKNAGSNDRFMSLFEMFGIEPRLLDKDMLIFDKSIEWDLVERKFNEFRTHSKIDSYIRNDFTTIK